MLPILNLPTSNNLSKATLLTGIKRKNGQDQVLRKNLLKAAGHSEAGYFLADVQGDRKEIQTILGEMIQAGTVEKSQVGISDRQIVYGSTTGESTQQLVILAGEATGHFLRGKRPPEFLS